MKLEEQNGTVVGLCISPLDVLIFRDGRPFGAGQQARSGLPMPQSLAGALRTALLQFCGCDFSRLADIIKAGGTFSEAVIGSGAPEWIARTAFAGPWVAKRQPDGLEPYLPIPACLHRGKDDSDSIFGLVPLGGGSSVPGWRPPEDEPLMRPLWLKAPDLTERFEGFLTLDGMRTFLSGEKVSMDRTYHGEKTQQLYAFQERTGIGISPDTFSTEKGLIYSAAFLELNRSAGICLYAEACLPNDGTQSLFSEIQFISLGGEGRRSQLSIVPPVKWPEVLPGASNQKPMALLISPGFFRNGWKPSVFSGCLAGAAVPGHLPISGWDLAKAGPKPTRFAAPAGSTYYLNKNDLAWPSFLADDDEDCLQGYGRYLKGVWTDGE